MCSHLTSLQKRAPERLTQGDNIQGAVVIVSIDPAACMIFESYSCTNSTPPPPSVPAAPLARTW